MSTGLRGRKMSQIQEFLETIQPELINTARLFGFSEADFQAPARFRFEAEEIGGMYRITFTDGERTVRAETAIPEDPDPRIESLHRKRAARRLCKQTLYDLCRQTTGIHPPWGSLTGVRPTHLMLEALGEGLSEEEAIRRLEQNFDVTGEKAKLLARIAGVQRGMPAPGDAWMDVYIGIPFCTTRCAYCSFSSGEIGNGRLVAPYMAALTREMAVGAQILQESGRRLRAVYVGEERPRRCRRVNSGRWSRP